MEADRSPKLSRRHLLRLSALGGLGLLGGCGRGNAPRLLFSRGELSAAWLKRLPAPWQGQALEGPADVLADLEQAALIQLPDGWLEERDSSRFQPFTPPGTAGATALFEALAPFARPAARLFTAGPARAWPWAFGTWLLVLRNRPDLRERQAEGWDLLLDPSLDGRLVMPSSPRVVIELALRQLGLSSTDPVSLADLRLEPQLRRLRKQALAFDDRDGLNLLLNGRADAAVIPSRRVLPLLRSDSRLTALLPVSGSPLWFNLLLRPSGEREPVPLEWLRQAQAPPLLSRLLAAGWVPPVDRQALASALAQWPPPVAELLYPTAAVLARCTALPPLTAGDRQRYQAVWDAARGAEDRL
jgi:hypothetical protein